mgnify:CR=1 FL=1
MLYVQKVDDKTQMLKSRWKNGCRRLKREQSNIEYVKKINKNHPPTITSKSNEYTLLHIH